MTARCPFCGEPEHVEVFEAWEDGTFMLDACCGGMHEAAAAYLADDPKAAAAWMAGELDAEALLGGRLRRVVGDGAGALVLDYQLKIVPRPWARVKAFIAQHHRHCKPPAGWRFGAGVMNGRQLVAVVSVGRPVARALDHRSVVEVNRLCVREDVPASLVWNACSLLYGWAAREAKRRGFERIITYTLDSESGVTLRAAGWSPDGTVRASSRGWDRAGRHRDPDGTPTAAKVRWCRTLRPARALAIPRGACSDLFAPSFPENRAARPLQPGCH